MDVIRHTAHAIAFAAGVSGDRSEIGVKGGTNGIIKDWDAILGAEDDVDEEIGERLRQGERINRAFSPLSSVGQPDPGRCPGLG
jgi:hypothetical protein